MHIYSEQKIVFWTFTRNDFVKLMSSFFLKPITNYPGELPNPVTQCKYPFFLTWLFFCDWKNQTVLKLSQKYPTIRNNIRRKFTFLNQWLGKIGYNYSFVHINFIMKSYSAHNNSRKILFGKNYFEKDLFFGFLKCN